MIWKDSAREHAAQLIQWLLTRKAAMGPGSGWPVETTITFSLQELGNCLVDPNSGFSTQRVLNEMPQGSSDLLNDFEAAYHRVVQRANVAANPPKRWTLILPIALRLDDKITAQLRLTIYGRDFTIARHSELTPEQLLAINPERLMASFLEQIDVPISSCFVLVEGHGHTSGEAWDRVAPTFDLFRGAIEFLYGKGQARIFASQQQPRSQIPYPVLVAGVSGHDVDADRLDVERRDGNRPLTLLPAHIEPIQAFCRELATEPERSSTLALVADALRLYAQALDARFNHTCLVALWQLAESTTCASDKHGSTDEVVRRLIWHTERWSPPGGGLRETLTELGKKRNEIVHHGIQVITEEEVNFLKYVCENTVQWLLEVKVSLPTRLHVSTFYRLRSAGAAAIRAEAEVSAFIAAQRHAR